MEEHRETDANEFDWFARDREGRLGLFSTAGDGPIPASARQSAVAHEVVGELIEIRDWGSAAVWQSYARAGLYAYDWSQSEACYVRVEKPESAMSPVLQRAVEAIPGLPELDLSFEQAQAVAGDGPDFSEDCSLAATEQERQRDALASRSSKRILIKLILALAALPVSLLLVRLSGYFFVPFLIALPLAVLYWLDLGQALRNDGSGGRLRWMLGIVMGVPQALLGLCCVVAGIAILVWLVYNTFIERQPEYRSNPGGWLFAPILVLAGVGWLFSAFRGDKPGDRP
ncbi:hypothetical protein [Lysobacter silvisoli]|uniref:Uncharacterized protein n=1 Tax=Lysobacter silvisoli TaxID=2293254 RepID=A0A371JZT3_9GAMM|nr:hypothetical protein [Lysobacter silvisoli]RDZ27178.1 hypothetical protein DX914_13055 [Lysobacter silvisoli]